MRMTMIRAYRAAATATARMICAFCLFTPMISNAAPWEYGVGVDLGIIYTDNVLLADDGMEQDEIVYTIAPSFFLATDGDRLDVNFNYRPEAYFYTDHSDADTVFHVLDASLTGALVNDRLFLFLGAANYQSIVTPEGNFPTSNLPITGNRVDSRNFEIRPYWQQRIGQADLYMDVAYREVDYDSDEIQSNDERSGRFELSNHERQQGLAWGLDYQYRQMEFESSSPWEFQRAALDLGFWVNGTMRIFGVVGAETSFENLGESNLDEDFWEVGFQYRPNQRLNIELAAGDRSYGNSFRGDFSYEMRRGNISLTYDEGPAVTGDQAFDYEPIRDTDNLDNILDRPGVNERYIRRRGELMVGIDLSKSELTLRVFAEERDLRMTPEGMPLEDESFSGAAIRWSWNLGTKTTMGVNLDISARERTGVDDKLRSAQVDLAYQMSQRLSLSLAVLHSIQEGQVLSTYDYTENQVRLMLRTEF